MGNREVKQGQSRRLALPGQIGKRLATGQSTIRDVLERIAANDPDLFVRDLDEQSFEGSKSSSGPAGAGRGGEAPAPQRRSSASSPPDAVPGASSHVASSQDRGGPRG